MLAGAGTEPGGGREARAQPTAVRAPSPADGERSAFSTSRAGPGGADGGAGRATPRSRVTNAAQNGAPRPRPREQPLGKKRASSSASDDALFRFDEQMGCARQLTPRVFPGEPTDRAGLPASPGSQRADGPPGTGFPGHVVPGAFKARCDASR